MSSYFTLAVTTKDINGKSKSFSVPHADSDVTNAKVQQFVTAFNTAANSDVGIAKIVLKHPQEEEVLYPTE